MEVHSMQKQISIPVAVVIVVVVLGAIIWVGLRIINQEPPLRGVDPNTRTLRAVRDPSGKIKMGGPGVDVP
jgi:hypothetical protein